MSKSGGLVGGLAEVPYSVRLSAIQEFREQLLARTVARAWSSVPFYQHLYTEKQARSTIRISDLPALPHVTKQELRSAGDEARDMSLTLVGVQNTSGTSGHVFHMYRSFEETSAINEFFGMVSSEYNGIRPAVLVLHVPSHGSPTALPAPAFVFQSIVKDRRTAINSLAALQHRVTQGGIEERISAISGGLHQVALFTRWLELQGQVLNDHIRTVSVTGDYCTRAVRDYLKQSWGCEPVVRYSLSEVFGGATFDLDSESFIFDIHCIPELVALDSGVSIGSGIGRLLLTALNPFVQMQPVIRYETGDLFEHVDLQNGGVGYRCLGRTKHALVSPFDRSRVWLTESDVLEATGAEPLLVREQVTRDLDGGEDLITGYPIVRGHFQEETGGDVSVTLRVAHTDKATREERLGLAERVRRRLLERPSLREDHDANRVRVVVEPIPARRVPAPDHENQSLWLRCDDVSPQPTPGAESLVGNEAI